MTIKEKILQFINDNDKPFSYKEVAMKLRIKADTAKKELKRMYDDGLIDRIKKGRNISYIQNPLENVRQLEKLIKLDEGELPKVSKLFFILPYPPQGDKNIGSLKILQNPMHPNSIYQRWAKKGDCQDRRGGYYESFQFEGKHKVTIQIYSSGKVQISLKCTKAPLDIIRYKEYLSFLDGLFYSHIKHSFTEFRDHFLIERCEFSKDTLKGFDFTVPKDRMCITVRTWGAFYQRIYEKNIDMDEYIRNEIGYEPLEADRSVNQFLNELQVAIAGGVNLQWLIHQDVQRGKTIIDIEKRLERRDDTIEFLVRQNQQQGLQLQKFNDAINNTTDTMKALYKAIRRLEDKI